MTRHLRLDALRLSLLAAVMIGSAQTALAGDWASDAGDDPEFAQTRALCVTARKTKIPEAPKTLAKSDCDAWSLLDGTTGSGAADPGAARVCAATRRLDTKDGEAWLQGDAVLATIYANGSGIERNYDLAIAYACHLDGAPAEVNGWVADLAKRKAGKGPDKPFDICDDATSGAMEGFCAERQSKHGDLARAAKLTALAKRIEPTRMAAFDKLQTAEKAFVQAVVDNEVDVSGTGRGAFIIEAQTKQSDAYVESVQAVLDKKLEATTAPAATQADKSLNQVYGKLMKLKDTSGLGTVTKDGIKTTQRKWLAYRDAFVAFAAKPDAAALTTRLTRQRTDELQALLGR